MVHGMQEDAAKALFRSAGDRGPRGLGVLQNLTLTKILAGALLGSGSAAAEPVVMADGALRVEVAESIEDAELFPGWIAERQPDLAVRLADAPGRERWIRVELAGEYLDFRFRVVPMRDGQVVGEEGEWVECPCSLADLMVELGTHIDGAVQRLREPVEPKPAAAEPEPTGEPEPEPEPTESLRVPTVEHRPISWLGWTGVGMGSLGVVGGITGGVLVAMGERVPSDYQHLQRDFRSPGVGVLVGGGVALVGGVTMLVVDLVQCKREHSRCAVEREGSGRRAAVRPWLGVRSVGIGGRF